MDERATRQPGEWQIVHVVRRTLWHIDEGWDDLDPRRRRQWFASMLVGLALLLGVTALIVVATRAMEAGGWLAWERAFLLRFERIVPVPFSWAIWLQSPGDAVVLWPVILAATAMAAWRRRPLVALTFISGFALLDAAVLLGWTMWERARPNFIAGGVASPSESLSAFPSGHVSQTLVAYGLLIALWVQMTRARGERLVAWSCLVFVVAMVAAGRLRLGAHWPSDIVAGAIIGALWLAVLLFALRRGEADRKIRS